MPNASQIEHLVRDYLASSIRKGALLITGEWGSGKTQLALTQLKPVAESLKFKTAYLSVADIDSLEGFESNLLLASHHWFNNRWTKALAHIGLSTLRHWGTRAGISVEALAALRNQFSRDTLIIVDDIERARPDLRKRILYRLAALQETKGLKTIILADETKIADEDVEYKTIKEKTITRTVEYQPTYEELAQLAAQAVYSAAPKLISLSPSWEISKILSEEDFSGLLASILHRGAYRNLRSAIAAATDSCEIFETLSATGNKFDRSVASSIVYSALAYSIELRNNSGRSRDLREFVDSGTQMQWVRFLNSGDASKDYLAMFESKYLHGANLEFVKSAALLDFLEKGTCDLKALVIQIISSRPTEEAAPAFMRLSRYRNLTQDEFDDLKAAAIGEVQNLKIRSFQSLGESAQILFYLAERDLLPLSPVQLRLTYTDSLERLAQDFLDGATDIYPAYEAGLMYGNAQGELKVVLEHIQHIHSKLDGELFSRRKKREIEKLASDPDAFVAGLISVDSQIATSACLEPEDARRIVEILGQTISDGEKPQDAIYKVDRAITNRYSARGLGARFHSEIHFLEQMKSTTQFLEAPDGKTLLRDALDSLKTSVDTAISNLTASK